MTERLWYPKFLIDENLPCGLKSPEAWLPALLKLHTPTEAGWGKLKPGDLVDFKYVDQIGIINVTIQPDATHSGALSLIARCAETPDMFLGELEAQRDPQEQHHAANSFWDCESETYAETLDEFAEMYSVMMNGETMTVAIQTAYWSDTFHYRISDDGKSLTLITPPTTASAQETPSC